MSKNEHTRRRERAEAAYLRSISPVKFWRGFGIQRAIVALSEPPEVTYHASYCATIKGASCDCGGVRA